MKVKHAKPGRHGDGAGLYLLVAPTGGKSWVLRVMVNGKRRDIGLGSASDLTLEEARDRARELRKVARTGGNPVAVRDHREVAPPTFKEAAIACHAAKERGWSERNAASFLSSLELHVFPSLGAVRVDSLSDRDVAAILSPLWVDKPAIAKKLRARVGLVLNYAKASGWRTEGAPREALSTLLPKQPDEGNLASMPYGAVPAFVADLWDKTDAAARLALLLQILTAARHGEVRSAMWSHFDLAAKEWHRPAALMKSGEAHTVTLSPQALDLLERAKALRGDDKDCLVFANRKGEQLSDNALSKIVRPYGFTAHGFRSTFRTWAAERMPNIPDAVAEAALAHKIPDKVVRAYNRAKFMELRRTLLDGWGAYVRGGSGKVVQFPSGVAG
nr:site-specific integrase [Alteraurantiacibacter buctensis]